MLREAEKGSFCAPLILEIERAIKRCESKYDNVPLLQKGLN